MENEKIQKGFWTIIKDQLSKLLKESLKLTNDMPLCLDVPAVIFDGLAANITMVNSLGANITNKLDQIKHWFQNPWYHNKKNIILDASHKLKLMRRKGGVFILSDRDKNCIIL